MVMSDDELTPRQKKMGWTRALVAAYVEERNQIATKKILGLFEGRINPYTGRPRRPERFEGPAYGWNPRDFWRRNRGIKDE
jgi:hypothetical protein